MLKAFFDDSGTHASSPVTVMAGLMAHEDDWRQIESEWADALGELGLPAMHMSHCENGQKAFSGWSRDRRDLAVLRFRSILLKHQALIVVSTLSQEVWLEALRIRPALQGLFESPLDYCFNSCIGKVARTRRKSAERPEPVVVVFDSREQSLANWVPLARSYQRHFPDKIAEFGFGAMKEVLPLQAADMVAYEAFVFECERVRRGEEPPPRPNFAALYGGLQYEGGFHTPDQLVKLADQILAELGEA